MKRRSARAILAVNEASTVEGMCSALKRCLSVLNTERNGSEFAEALKNTLREKSQDCRRKSSSYISAGRFGSNVHIYCGVSACLIFAGFKASLCSDVEELRGQIEYLIDFFCCSMTKPETGVLTAGEAGDLLGIAQDKYGLISAVTCEMELEIYLIERSHISYDSFLLTYKNARTGVWLNKWLLFSLSPRMGILQCNKYHVFMHELGHVLYNAVTGGGSGIPSFFGEIAFLLGIPLDNKIISPDELFADLFSASALRESKYTSFNPFAGAIEPGVYELLELYFRMLGQKAERDRYGVSAVDNILH